jgi:hypothetical protein
MRPAAEQCVKRAQALAEELLAESLPQRWRHVQAVATEAARLCPQLGHDLGTVVCAAWLHDIGYSPALTKSGFPLDGARYLRAHGWPEPVCGLVAHHTDAARLATEYGLGETLRSEFAPLAGVDRDVLWAADATTGPAGQRLTLEQRIEEISDRYGPAHRVTAAMIASRDVLHAAIGRVQQPASRRPAEPSLAARVTNRVGVLEPESGRDRDSR